MTTDGTPSATDGTPATTDGTPLTTDGTPSATDGTPAATDGTPSSTDSTPATTDGTPSTTDGTPSATDGTPTTTDSTMAVDGVGISDMIDGTPVDPDDPSLITYNGLTDDILMLGAGAPMDTTDPNAMDGSEDGTVQNRDGASDSSLQQLNENIYTLVNHNGSDTSLHSDGEIVVLAAGVNVIDSISGETIIFAGSGILIVNSLEGERSFQTLIDIYDQGSVAVFVKSGENEYTLINGDVPGILDEDYLIEGYTLIMPDQSQLLICGTGVSLKDKEGNESVNYYHGTNHEYESTFLSEEEAQNYIEYTGNLTIGNDASLVVQEGATINIENLRSTGQTETYDWTRYPTITVTDGGNLTIIEGGIITGGGYLTLSGQGTLTGAGTVQTSKVYIDSPDNVAGFQGLFAGIDGKLTIIYLKGTGTYSNLSFSNCTVDMTETEGQADLSGVSTSGGTVFLLKGGEDLEIDSVDGNLSVRSRGYTYNDNITVSGNIGGTGTISFDCGIYHLAEGLTLNGASINQNSGAVIIDHAGVLETSMNLIHIDPDDVTPSSQSGYYIPAVCAALSEHNEPYQLLWIEVLSASYTEESVAIGSYPGIIYPEDLVSLINEYRTQSEIYANYLGFVYLLHYKDGKYWMQEFSENALKGDSSGIEQVDLTDVCLIQVQLRNDTHYDMPAGTATQTNTAYTGSGILGGAGAGSVHYGTSTNNDNGNGNNNNNGNGNNNNNGNGNNNNNGNGSNNDNGSGNSQKGNQDAAFVQTGGETNLSFWIEQVIIGKQYVLHAVDGEKTLREFGGKVRVVIHLELPHEDAGKTMYAVFRTADGTLKAFQISYSILKSELVFVADTLGEFVLVAFDFEGEEFSKEFYEALEQIVEI